MIDNKEMKLGGYFVSGKGFQGD